MELNFKLIGQKVKKFRTQNKMTQSTLAEYTNITDIYISNIETGKKHASLETLVQISNVLGVTMDMLLVGNLVNENKLYYPELTLLLQDCSSYERRIIYDIAIAVKESLSKYRDLE